MNLFISTTDVLANPAEIEALTYSSVFISMSKPFHFTLCNSINVRVYRKGNPNGNPDKQQKDEEKQNKCTMQYLLDTIIRSKDT